MNYNDAWKKLFADLHIAARLDADGRFDLAAEKIKTLTGKEPRNMSKWDTRDARPDVLQKAGVTILPTSRHGYTLVRGDGYCALPLAGPARYHSPAKLQPYTTLPWQEELTRESAAIDVAAISLMLQKFTGDHELALTIRGRSGTPAFAFRFRGQDRVHRLAIDRAQVEVDAGFEGDKIWLLEAKLGEPADFLVRQLYYPWRLWREITEKEVVPVFLSYVNKTFGLFRYSFDDPEDYHSVQLREHGWFTLDEPSAVRPLGELFAETGPVQRPPGPIPFPQADTLGTVITTVELFAHEAARTTDIAMAMNFDDRQGIYYAAAARWLGFVEGVRRLRVTREGERFVRASRWERFELVFRAVAATPVFREAIRAKLEGHPLTEGEITEMIERPGYATKTTAKRRSKTVASWLEWLWREHANLAASG
jgi:hypothetical protein